jgi:hypothetical protein
LQKGYCYARKTRRFNADQEKELTRISKGGIKKCHTSHIFSYLDNLFSQHIENIRPHTIEQKGQLLQKTRRALEKMNAQARSELNITRLLLPERYKLSPYYETLSSDMDEKQKALAMRWWLERIRTNQDKSNAINRRTDLNRFFPDISLHRILYHYYGRLNKREIYTCDEILYSIWDSYEGYYDDVVSNLLTEHKTLFTTRRKADATIQRLIDKGIISCKIYFRESGTNRLLKPKRMLNLSKDVEIAAMSDLARTNEKDTSAHDPMYDDYSYEDWY